MKIVFGLMGVAVNFVQERPCERDNPHSTRGNEAGDPHDFSRAARSPNVINGQIQGKLRKVHKNGPKAAVLEARPPDLKIEFVALDFAQAIQGFTRNAVTSSDLSALLVARVCSKPRSQPTSGAKQRSHK